MILITGSNGFLGSAVVRALAEQTDEAITCLVRPNSSTARLDDLVASGRATIRRGVLSSRADAASAIDGATTIFHLAAGMGGGAMADVWLSTVVATRNLLAAVTDLPDLARFVHCSSFSVYGVGSLPKGTTVDETTLFEPRPAERDDYGHAKARQEQLVREAFAGDEQRLVVVRPGVVYGPGGNAISGRIGLKVGPLMVKMGRRNLLPITYVENCADAMALVGLHPDAAGETINVVDDELVTASDYLRRYQRAVGGLLVIPVPWFATKLLGNAVSWYHDWSNGQLPAALTPYIVRANWGGNDFDNSKLRRFGWTQRVSTEDGLDANFAALAASVG